MLLINTIIFLTEDSFHPHNGMMFSTKENDNETWEKTVKQPKGMSGGSVDVSILFKRNILQKSDRFIG